MGTPLIIGAHADPHVSAVASALGGECFVVDVQELGASRFTVGPSTTEIELDGRHWSGGRCRGWARRLSPMGWEAGAVVGSLQATAKAAWLSLLAALLRHPDVEWLSAFDRMNAAENKLTQAVAASRLKIQIPATVVSNRVESVRRIRGPLIAKPLGPSHYRKEDDEWITVFTEAFDPEVAVDEGLLAGPPFIVQHRLEARSHLRIVTVNDRAWVFRLDARGLSVDWREEPRAHRAWEYCPQHDAAPNALRLSRALGLGYSSQDWCETKNGPLHLDLNPAGQWLFLPRPAADEVTMAIAEWLRSE